MTKFLIEEFDDILKNTRLSAEEKSQRCDKIVKEESANWTPHVFDVLIDFAKGKMGDEGISTLRKMGRARAAKWYTDKANSRKEYEMKMIAICRASGNGGFSTAYYLNGAYKHAYNLFDKCEFFFVQGAENPADAPSRSTTDVRILEKKIQDIKLPRLEDLEHRYIDRPPCGW